MSIRFHQLIWLLYLTRTLLVQAEWTTVDDFRTRDTNNIGGVRSGLGVNVDLIYPQDGITVRHSGDFLLETVAPLGEHLDLSRKSLKIDYTAFSPGKRCFMFQQFLSEDSSDLDVFSFRIKMPVHEGRHELVFPLSHFKGAELRLAHMLGIGGPLVVHAIHWIDSAELKTDVEEVRVVQNVNNLGMLRDGSLITKVKDGVDIKLHGYLNETLVPDTDQVDLRNTKIRITYSATHRLPFKLMLQYHRHYRTERPIAAQYHKGAGPGSKRTIEFRIKDFPSVLPFDVKSICILGPATVHRIEVVGTSFFGGCVKMLTRKKENVVLVDDLATWPDPLRPTLKGKKTQPVPSTPPVPVVNDLMLRENRLRCTCGGSGALITDRGIKISKDGSIFEQLASRSGTLDLTGAYIEIEYSADQPVVRQLLISRAVSSGSFPDYQVDPDVIDVEFSEGTNLVTCISVKEFGLTQGIQIVGCGELTLHRIQLLVPASGDALKRIVVNDFVDWLTSMNPSTDTTSHSPDWASLVAHIQNERHDPVVFDYRTQHLNDLTVLCECTMIPGEGIEILRGGFIWQTLPGTVGKYLKITYSKDYLGVNKIILLTNLDEHADRIEEHVMCGMFSAGIHVDAVLQLPNHSQGHGPLSVIGIRIPGPLIVHQIEFVNSVHGSADTVLVDDFLDWTRVHSNKLGCGREYMGTNGLGYINLHGQDEYLVEHIAGNTEDLDYKHMAVQIVYTCKYPAVSRIALVLEIWHRGVKTYAPHDFQCEEILFEPGYMAIKIIPFVDLWVNSLQRAMRIFGIIIFGPRAPESSVSVPITLHKIRLMASFHVHSLVQ